MDNLSVKEQDVLKRIIDKPELQSHFFNNASDVKWLNSLIEKKILSPESVPKPEPAEEEGYFRIRKWSLANYLSNIKEQLIKPENRQHAETVWGIIKSVTRYARKNSFSNYHVWWRFAEIMQYIPSDIIDTDEWDKVIGYWLSDIFSEDIILSELGNKLLPALLKKDDKHSKELAMVVIKNIYAIETIEKDGYDGRKKKEVVFKVKDRQNYYIKDITKNHAKTIGKELNIKVRDFFLRQLTDVVSISNNDEWCNVWQPAIEDHKQNKFHDECENILVCCLRDLLLGCMENQVTDEVFNFVESCLHNELFIIQRIAIYMVAEKYKQLKTLTDKIINIGLSNHNYRHEYWHFLNKHFSTFNTTQKKNVINVIENVKIEGEYSNDKKYCAYKKAQWYSAIKDLDNEASKKYQECLDAGIEEPEHPDFGSYSYGVRSITHTSPYSIDELVAMDVSQLIETINNYKEPTESFMGDEPDLQGLCEALQGAVKAAPEKYISTLDVWLDLPPYFIDRLLSAYASLWKEKVAGLPWDSFWNKILIFCEKLVSKESFWTYSSNEDRERGFVKRNYVPGTIAELIELGVKDDDHAFDAEYLTSARRIVVIMLDKVDGGNYEKSSLDAMTTAINSHRGKCLEALINLALRECRLSDKKKQNHAEIWERNYQEQFEKESDLVKSGKTYDFAPLATSYLLNFLYLSKKWTLDNLNRFFYSPKENEIAWLAAMQGYSYVSKLSLDIYNYLKDTGCLLQVLDTPELRESAKKNVIQQAVVVFLWDKESLKDDDCLLSKIFERQNIDELQQVFWFLQTLRSENENENIKIRPKVYELWNQTRQILDLTNQEHQKLASSLCSLSVFFNELDDETMDLILSVCNYAGVSWNSPQVIKTLAKLVCKYPDQVFRVYMKMLEGVAPSYPKEKIAQIIKGIKENGTESDSKIKSIFDAYIKSDAADLVIELKQLMSEVSKS